MERLAWHFVGSTLHDGRAIPADGEVLRHDGPLVMCKSGLHFSVRAIDALPHAPDAIVCRVKYGDNHRLATDNGVADERTILWRANAMAVLRKFARQCALDVAHLWKMPPVVREYLETGDTTRRLPALIAAKVAATRYWANVALRDSAWPAAVAAEIAAEWPKMSASVAADASKAAEWAMPWVAAGSATDAMQNTRLTAALLALEPV